MLAIIRDNSLEISDIQKELGMKEGFDVAMEMSGNPAALDSILDNICHGAKITLLGIMPQATPVDWNKVVFNGVTIKGIYGREMFETWYKMTAMLQYGLDITPLITHKFHYTDYLQGFEVMRSGQSGKVILNCTEKEQAMALEKLDKALAAELILLQEEGRSTPPERIITGYLPPSGERGTRYTLLGEDKPFLRMNSNSYLSLLSSAAHRRRRHGNPRLRGRTGSGAVYRRNIHLPQGS